VRSSWKQILQDHGGEDPAPHELMVSNLPSRERNASVYHRVSDPQFEWD
jgi:hypothetical protein